MSAKPYLGLRLQRYEKNRICARAMRFLFIGRPQTGSYLGFRGVDERADDEAAECGIGIGVSVGIAVGFLAVVGVLLFPLGTEFGGVHDDRGLFDCLCERRNGLLARGSKRTFIRMFDYISMRATVAGAHDNLIGRTEFARHGVEGMRESGPCHRVRQSSRIDRFAVRPPCC